MDYTVHQILQARILEWVAFPFSRGSSQPRDRAQVSLIAGDSLPAEPQGKPLGWGPWAPVWEGCAPSSPALCGAETTAWHVAGCCRVVGT